ncbi:hypothetical protein ACET3Z_016377 [Daucus carota]
MPRLTVRHLQSLHHQSPPLPNPIQNPNPPIINPSFIPHRPIFNSNPHSIYPVHHVLNPNYKNERKEYKFFSKVFAEDSVKITNYYEKNCESGEFSCLVCAGLGQKVGKKLDRALIRTGRMDKHILMSYCSFELFKVLTNKYLNIRFHELFVKIEQLLGEVAVTPAQVVEYLIPKSAEDDVFAEDSELRSYYEKNCESGEISCFVCAGLGQKAGKKYKDCVALVQHATTITKTKKRHARKAVGEVICKDWKCRLMAQIATDSASEVSAATAVSFTNDVGPESMIERMKRFGNEDAR